MNLIRKCRLLLVSSYAVPAHSLEEPVQLGGSALTKKCPLFLPKDQREANLTASFP